MFYKLHLVAGIQKCAATILFAAMMLMSNSVHAASNALVVNDYAITKTDVAMRQAILNALDQPTPTADIVRTLADEYLLKQAAAQENITPDDERVRDFRTRVLQYLKVSPQNLPNFAQKNGFDVAAFEEFIKAQPLKNALLLRRFPSQANVFSDSELQQAARVWLAKIQATQRLYKNCTILKHFKEDIVMLRPLELAPDVAQQVLNAPQGTVIGPLPLKNGVCARLQINSRTPNTDHITDEEKRALEDRLLQADLQLQAEAMLRDLRANALIK